MAKNLHLEGTYLRFIKFCKIEFLWRSNLAYYCIAPNFCSVIKTSDLNAFAKHLVKNTCNYVPHDHSIHVSCGKQLQSLKPSSIGMAFTGIGLKAHLKTRFIVFRPQPEGFSAFSTSDHISEY